MKIFLEWENPIPLIDGSDQNLMYVVDPERLPKAAGVYVFGRRRRNGGFEALYVGKADNIRGRVWGHRKNLPLMMHLKNARQGQLVVRAGRFNARPGQTPNKCIPIIERALIRYFLSEGHDLVNKAGTRLRRHEISTVGRHPNLFIPKLMFVDAEGENSRTEMICIHCPTRRRDPIRELVLDDALGHAPPPRNAVPPGH